MTKKHDDNQEVIATLTVHNWDKFTKRERERFYLWMRNQILTLSNDENSFSKRYTARLFRKVK